MKRLLIVISLIIFGLITAVKVYAHPHPEKIGILLVDDVLHDKDTINGFKEGIELSGILHTFDLREANGDKIKAKEFIRKWRSEGVGLICTVGTKATLWAMEEVKDIPIVFTAVTNPVIAGIADTWQGSGSNVTGASNWIDMEEKLKVYKQAVPNLGRLGVIYNPDNPVSSAEITEAKKVCQTLGITLKEQTCDRDDQMEKSVHELIDKGIDALWIPIEKIVYMNIEDIAKITIPRRLPVVSSTFIGIDCAKSPAVIVAVGVDYEMLGRMAALSAVDILASGKAPGEVPISTVQNYEIVINANAADLIGHQIPPRLMASASRIVKGFKGQRIIVGGTGDNQDMLRILARVLEERLDGAEIEVPDVIGSTGGIRGVNGGEIDLARVARLLNENEEQLGLIYRPFAKSAIVFVVNPSVSGIENITTEEIIGIYSGKITHWNQLGVDKGKIYPVARETGDSCLRVLNEKLPGFKEITNPRAKIIYNTPKTVETLEKYRNTIGYVPLSAIMDTNLRILKVNGIYPSMENIENGSYGLTVPYGIVHKGEITGLAKRFLDFLYSEEAKKIIIANGAFPVH
ncbi:MAG: ABC transporter substrate binding protein [bacterium]